MRTFRFACWLAGAIAATISVAAVAPQTAPVTVVHRPYLQNGSASAMSVLWATRENGVASLRVVPPSGDSFDVPAVTKAYPASVTGLPFDYYQHEARVEGLDAATAYTYEARLDGESAGSGSFRTFIPPGSGTVRFAAFGDIGSGSPPPRRIAGLVGAEVTAGTLDLVLLLGDVSQAAGSYAAYHTWFFPVFRGWLGRVPVFPAIGNHDEYATAGKPYYQLFSLPGNGYPPFPGWGERFYSFDAGPVHFVALDSETAFKTTGGARAAQLAWLEADLAATTQPWKVVYFHRPMFTVSTCCTDVRAVFAPVLERHGVQLALSGHVHLYARSVPWKSSGQTGASPIVHVVAGGAPSSLNRDGMLTDWRAFAKSTNHYLRAAVSGCQPDEACRLDLEAVDLDGVVFDRFTLGLRDQARDSAPPSVQRVQPIDGARITGDLLAQAEASDDVRVEKVDLVLRNPRGETGEQERVIAIALQPPYDLSWNTLGTPDGFYGLSVRAHDIAGRRSRSQPATIEIANGGAWIVKPNGGEKLRASVPYVIEWLASEAAEPLARFDLSVAAGSSPFAPIAGCTALPPEARSCTWTMPGPISKQLIVRIVATGASGRKFVDKSDAIFSVSR